GEVLGELGGADVWQALDAGQPHVAEGTFAARDADLVLADLDAEESHAQRAVGSVVAMRSSATPSSPSSTATPTSTPRPTPPAAQSARHAVPSKQRTRKSRTFSSTGKPVGS